MIELFSDKYFIAAVILGLCALIIVLLIYLLRKYVHKTYKRKSAINTITLMKLETPIILMGVVLAVEIVIDKILQADATLKSSISNISQTLVVIAFSYLIMIIADLVLIKWSKNLNKQSASNAHEEVLPLFRSIKNILISIIAIFLILQLWGVGIGGLVASLGIVGLILSFAFKDTLANIFGGISLIMDNSFNKGDLIELDDGEIGYIEELNLRSTKIRNFNAEEVIIPNGLLANMKFKNYAHPSKSIRIKIEVSVAYGSEPSKVRQVLMTLLKHKTEVLKFPKPKLFFTEMGDYALKFKLLFFIKDYNDMYNVKSQLMEEVYNELRKNKIEIPFPTRKLVFDKKRKII